MKNALLLLTLAAAVLAGCDSSPNRRAQQPTAPTIGNIADQTTTANQPAIAIDFGITDDQPDTVLIQAMSDDPDTVSQSGLTVGGIGSNRTLTIAPNADVTGDAMITLIATDRTGLMASTSFLLSVDAEQRSMQQLTRSEFALDGDDEPLLINAIEFQQDAEEDDFADLLTP